MSEQTVKLAIVGHANTGKTSLMRTLLRDASFGQIADYAGTTRQVEGAALMVNGEALVNLFDTPGLEDSMALLEQWQTIDFPDHVQTVAARMAFFLALLGDQSEFEQERKVLQQALKSDALLYVIDAREPCLGKYADELTLLAATGKPIIPVLNFVQDNPDNSVRWREKLLHHQLHAVVEYDTVAFTIEAERRLYEKLQSVLERYYQPLQRLQQHLRQQHQLRRAAAMNCLLTLLVDVAAYRLLLIDNQSEQIVERLQSTVRQAEQRAITDLLTVFGFSLDDVRSAFLPVAQGRWRTDLFDPSNLAEAGAKTGSDAAKGAAVGVGIDIMVGGVSLGAGAALGAVAGVVLGSVRRYGDQLWSTLTGRRYACVDEATLRLLWVRQWQLINDLSHRGHAAQQPAQLADDQWQPVADWQRRIRRLRRNPHWSGLGSRSTAASETSRTAFIDDWAAEIEQQESQ